MKMMPKMKLGEVAMMEANGQKRTVWQDLCRQASPPFHLVFLHRRLSMTSWPGQTPKRL